MPTVMIHFPLGPLPAREVHLPEAHAGRISQIHRALSLERRACVASGKDTAQRGSSPSEIQETRRPRQGCAAWRLHRIGSDWRHRLESWCDRERNVPAHYIDVNLGEPAAPSVILALREAGWRYGGLLIERSETDYLRLQRASTSPATDGLVLHPAARDMLDFVLADRLA